jgi:hypothetical protein
VDQTPVPDLRMKGRVWEMIDMPTSRLHAALPVKPTGRSG